MTLHPLNVQPPPNHQGVQMSVQPIGVYRAPTSEPPCETSPRQPLYAVPGPHHQLSLLPFEPEPVVLADVRVRRALEAGLPGALDRYFGPQRTSRDRLPPAGPFARLLCTALAEVLTGFRVITQLRDRCTAEVFGWVEDNSTSRPRHGGIPRPPVVSAVRVCEPADGVAEVSAVIRHGARSRALVARLVGIDGAWRCVSLQVL